MSFRTEHKSQREKISAKLIDGALSLAAAQGYGSLSLRSVAREAGIAPTSFYRHFRDMDEMGLAMAH
ncbi:MAG: TetR family transcriptional regulator, partial [Pseudomonadota bacterium]